MPRQLRLEYEGAIYHVMNRGDRREDIVLGDADRELFVSTLGETCVKCGWEVHAWCLMRNHFHLAVETPLGNLVAGMKWFLGAYAIRFNARNQLRGHLFAGRYKSLVVDDGDPHYLRVVCDYIHFNPSRARLVKGDQPLETYPWSSYPDYLKKPADRTKWLRTDRVFGEHGIRRDDRRGRLEFSRRMEKTRQEESEAAGYREIRRGWRFGGEEFVARMLDQIEETRGKKQAGREYAENMEQRAKRIVAEGLQKAGWAENRLRRERKGHPTKVRIALKLRRETTMKLQWIAETLCMGSWTYVSNLLRVGAAA